MLPKHRVLNAALVVIILLQLAVVFHFSFEKQGYFKDEIYSYIYANTYYKNRHFPSTILYDQWMDADSLVDLVLVAPEHRFAFDSVFYNQSEDVHPPLYYIFLDTVCSFFPQTFSKWYGLSVNMIFFVLALVFLFLISRKLFGDRLLALLPMLLWGFSAGAVNTVIFIRMYMMLTTFTLMLAYLHIDLMEKSPPSKRFAAVYACVLLGFMTHYYFLVFFFLFTSVYVFSITLQKRWPLLFKYLLANCAAILTGYLIFPSSYRHVFLGYRGKAAFASATVFSDFANNLSKMWSNLNMEQFGGWLDELILGGAGICLLLVLVKAFAAGITKRGGAGKAPAQPLREVASGWKVGIFHKYVWVTALTITVTAAFLVISKVSPFLISRYLYFLYPVMSLLIVYYLYQAWNLWTRNWQIFMAGMIFLFAVVTFSSYKNGQVAYTYPNENENIATAQLYQDFDCIYITRFPWNIEANLFQLAEFKNLYSMHVEQVDDLPEILSGTITREGLVLYLGVEYDQAEVSKQVLAQTGLKDIKFLFHAESARVYLIQ